MNEHHWVSGWSWGGVGFLAILSVLMAGCASFRPKVIYPATARGDRMDEYHGTRVADPYRWLEDPDAPETIAWVKAQNEVTFGFLKQIAARDPIRERMTQLWNYERYGVPFKAGHRYFYSRNNGLQNQAVLFTAENLNDEPRLLLDPNTLAKDGTVALAGMSVSDDGNLLAYGLSGAGSDWQTWKVRDVRTGQDLPDELRWLKFSGASWTKDHAGFYYSRYAEPQGENSLKAVNRFQKIYYHRLGTEQSQDRLVYERPDQPEWGLGGHVTDDGRYLIISAWRGTDTKNGVFYQDLQAPGAPVVELLKDFDADYTFLDNDGPVFWFRTDLQAPRGRIVAMDIRHPAREHWREMVAQNADTLVSGNIVSQKLILNYLKDARSVIKLHRLDGSLEREITLPGLGTASGFGGKRQDTETFYLFTSYTRPATIYRLDLAADVTSVFKAPKVGFKPDDYETTQVFYPSRDGTRIPMFITHRKGLKPDGNLPVYLYGYGGFNISLTPSFSVASLIWMEMGGVLAIPNLRGGGEYGEQWHQGGMKGNKQKVFDDFIAAAEWLIANRYTCPKKLAIGGGSNGGLLVGACLTQRPELFGAALPAVGVMDMLRFHKFTIGWAWAAEYGSSDKPEDFKNLLAYSPLHNLKPGTRYPATMITTGDHDDRVVPAHSFKFAAELQRCHRGAAPVLIRIETKAGHGAGKPTVKMIEEAADKWAFLYQVLGMRPVRQMELAF